MNNVILETKKIRKYFYPRTLFKRNISIDKIITAVDDVDLILNKKSILVIAGESGSGKSTLARIITKVIKPDSGNIFFDGKDVTKKLDKKKLLEFRSNIQMIYQDPYGSLNPRMKIKDILLEPINIHFHSESKNFKQELLFKVLKDVYLPQNEDFVEKLPNMLSGGQRQRINFARSLVLRPKVIIADEPVSMLDAAVRLQILNLMNELKIKFGISFLYITHDLMTAKIVGDSILILYKGSIVESGEINQVINNPLHPYTQALINAISTFDSKNVDRLKPIKISFNNVVNIQQGCKFCNNCPKYMDQCRNKPKLISYNNINKHYVRCFLYD